MLPFPHYYPSLPVRQMAGEPLRVLDKHGWTQAVAQDPYIAQAIVRAFNAEPFVNTALDILAKHENWEQDAYEMVQAIAVAARTLGLVEDDDRFIPKGAS